MNPPLQKEKIEDTAPSVGAPIYGARFIPQSPKSAILIMLASTYCGADESAPYKKEKSRYRTLRRGPIYGARFTPQSPKSAILIMLASTYCGADNPPPTKGKNQDTAPYGARFTPQSQNLPS
jgi:hypothetical protein